MGKSIKFLTSIMATMLLAGALTGCGGSDKPAESGDSDKKLVVYSHLKPEEIEEIDKIAKKWGEEKGVKVSVQHDQAGMQEFIQLAKSSKAPDIMFGLANDNLGTFQKAGLLAEVPSGIIDESQYVSKQLIESITIGGKKYAVPIAQETSALFYNKDLVKEAPKTMEEVVKIGETKGFKYAIDDFYRSYGFIAANGGYVFKNNNGTLDPNEIGLNNEGAIKGYEFIRSLVQEYKLMPPDIKDDIANAEFKSGKSAFYISGPWDIESFKEAGVNFGVVPMPTLNGNQVKTFSGVQTAFVSESSKNKDLAWDLIKYLQDNAATFMLEKGNRIPVLNSMLNSDEVKKNEYMKAFIEQSKHADPMPNIPEVQAMWNPAADNIKLMNAGQLTAKECADRTVEQIKEGIAQQK